ncbi:MAG TPA: hypothetical protein VM529_08590 [Gemmata sp.]|nr:hypothetical protein [Gemmata sp.]
MSEHELREVDYRIAREVFDWSAEEVDAVRWCEAGSVVDCANTTRELPRYSTDIAAAWLVVEKLRQVVAGFELLEWPELDEPYCASFGHRLGRAVVEEAGLPSGVGTAEEEGKTAPIAICRAALAYVRGEWQELVNGRFVKRKGVGGYKWVPDSPGGETHPGVAS